MKPIKLKATEFFVFVRPSLLSRVTPFPRISDGVARLGMRGGVSDYFKAHFHRESAKDWNEAKLRSYARIKTLRFGEEPAWRISDGSPIILKLAEKGGTTSCAGRRDGGRLPQYTR